MSRLLYKALPWLYQSAQMFSYLRSRLWGWSRSNRGRSWACNKTKTKEKQSYSGNTKLMCELQGEDMLLLFHVPVWERVYPPRWTVIVMLCFGFSFSVYGQHCIVFLILITAQINVRLLFSQWFEFSYSYIQTNAIGWHLWPLYRYILNCLHLVLMCRQ